MSLLKERWSVSLAVTVVAHLLAAAVLGIFVFLHPVQEIEPEILDVSLAEDVGPAAPTAAQAAPVPPDVIAEQPQEQALTQPEKQAPSPETNRQVSNGSPGTVSTGSSSGSGTQAAAGTGTAPAGPPPGTNVPVTRPYKVSGGYPAYPDSARAKGIQGTVYVRALVNTSGAVASATISGSSGDASLDRAVLNAVYGWGFSPARDRYGARCRCYVSVPVSFRLK